MMRELLDGPGPRPAAPDSIWSKDPRLKEYLGTPFVRDTLASLLDRPVEVKLDRMLPKGVLGRSGGGEPLSMSPALFYEGLLGDEWKDENGKLPDPGLVRSLFDDVLTHEIAHEADSQGAAPDVMDRARQDRVRGVKISPEDRENGYLHYVKREGPAQAAEIAMRSMRLRQPPKGIPGVGTMRKWMEQRVNRTEPR